MDNSGFPKTFCGLPDKMYGVHEVLRRTFQSLTGHF